MNVHSDFHSHHTSTRLDTAHAWPIVHPTAEVSPHAQIGAGTFVWHRVHVREYATIGSNCTIGNDVYIDYGVQIGNNVKIQNKAMLYHGVCIEDGVFIGPQACVANERNPRAITASGVLKPINDAPVQRTTIQYGASLSVGAIVMAGLVIGRFAMIAPSAVVMCDVPNYGLVVGMPARLIGFVCACGEQLELDGQKGRCPACNRKMRVQGLPK